MNLFVRKALDLLYPRCCPICHEILENQQSLICPACERKLRPIGNVRCCKCGKPVENQEEYCGDCVKHPHSFYEGRGIFLYNDVLRRSLVRYKYYGRREYGDFFGEAMSFYGKKEISRWKPDFLVPVPLHKSKERRRGFNQAACLARRISLRTGIPVDESLVDKVINTKSQKKLSAAQRKQNLKKAFVVRRFVEGKVILLVDDVYTTGSTMDALAECLLEKGAKRIYFLTLCIGKN